MSALLLGTYAWYRLFTNIECLLTFAPVSATGKRKKTEMDPAVTLYGDVKVMHSASCVTFFGNFFSLQFLLNNGPIYLRIACLSRGNFNKSSPGLTAAILAK